MSDPLQSLDRIKKEIPVIRGAPFSFIAMCLLVALFCWAVNWWHYSGKIENLESAVSSKQNLLDDCQRKNDDLKKQNSSLNPESVGNLASQKIADNPTPAKVVQWYLKIKSIEVVPKSTNDHPQTIPFRIVAQVNSQNYSFPNAQLCFMGETTQGGEAVPLPMEREKYLIQFVRQNIKRNFARVSITNSFIPNQGSQTDFCEIKDLPLTKTNEVFTQDLQAGIDFGVTRIIYQISEN